jgi:hypothetical protein
VLNINNVSSVKKIVVMDAITTNELFLLEEVLPILTQINENEYYSETDRL